MKKRLAAITGFALLGAAAVQAQQLFPGTGTGTSWPKTYNPNQINLFDLVYRNKSNPAAGNLTGTIKLIPAQASDTAGIQPIPFQGWISPPVFTLNSSLSADSTDIVFLNGGITLDFSQELVGQGGWGPGGSGDLNFIGGTCSAFTAFELTCGNPDQYELTSFLVNLSGPEPRIATSTAQPYADGQSLGLDVLRQQREGLLERAGNCEQDGIVLAGNKTRASSLCAFAIVGNGQGHVNGNASLGGYSTANFNSSYGVEYKINRRFSIGAAYGYATANLSSFSFENTAAAVASTASIASLYGTYQPSETARVVALLGYGTFNYNGQRAFNNGIAIAATNATSSYSANGTNVALRGELAFRLGNKPLDQAAKVKPFLGVSWANHSQQPFTEQGNGYLLSVEGNTASSLLGTIGTSLDLPIILNQQARTILTPSLTVAYQGDALANSSATRSINASLATVPDSGVSVSGQNMGASTMVINLGANLQIGANTSLYAGTLYRLSSNGNQFNYGGGFKVTF